MILTTFSLACTSLSFRRANTWMCELTCFRVLVLPVRNLMYRAISSLRPRGGGRAGSEMISRWWKKIYKKYLVGVRTKDLLRYWYELLF